MKIVSIQDDKKVINKDNLYDFLINNPLNKILELNPPVSFDNNEIPISYFNDLIWDFSYDKIKHKAKSCSLNFNNYKELNKSFMEEFKFLVIITYLSNYHKYSSSHEIKRIAACLHPIINTSQMLGNDSICNLNDEIKFISVMEEIKGKYTFRTLENILSTFKSANFINTPYFDLNLQFSTGLKSVKDSFNAKALAIKYSKTQSNYVSQTLYIPNKIHSKLISSCIEILSTKMNEIPKLMKFLEEDYLIYEQLKSNLDLDVSNTQAGKKITYKRRIETRKLLEKYDLLNYSSTIEVQKEVRITAIACIVLMLNFSGMRINELLNIQVDGFSIINSEPILYILRSYETKISGGQIVDYITSPIVQDAFNTLKIIHELAKKYDKTVSENDLLVSSKHQKLLGYGYIGGISEHLSYLSKELNLIIDSEDIKESELINGPREDIKLGELWPLASHQFRRTLVVNFVSHRLGTINAVKQQVKHMYATMTEYYAKNSQLADTFKLNVVKEIADNIEEELLNEGVRQYKQFYQSNEILSGIKGKEIIEERKTTKVLSDDEIKQLFKTGLYKISKSMYGYCTKGNLCDKKEAIDPTFCGASCSTMVITKENAENWQKLYFRNKKLLNSSNDLMIGGVPMNAAKTTMQSQNEVAKKIMNDFNMKYED